MVEPNLGSQRWPLQNDVLEENKTIPNSQREVTQTKE